MTETAYLVKRNGGITALINFLHMLIAIEPPIVPITFQDLDRAKAIFDQYQDNKRFDFVDVAIMAITERLRVEMVCTFDRVDFKISDQNTATI